MAFKIARKIRYWRAFELQPRVLLRVLPLPDVVQSAHGLKCQIFIRNSTFCKNFNDCLDKSAYNKMDIKFYSVFYQLGVQCFKSNVSVRLIHGWMRYKHPPNLSACKFINLNYFINVKLIGTWMANVSILSQK